MSATIRQRTALVALAAMAVVALSLWHVHPSHDEEVLTARPGAYSSSGSACVACMLGHQTLPAPHAKVTFSADLVGEAILLPEPVVPPRSAVPLLLTSRAPPARRSSLS